MTIAELREKAWNAVYSTTPTAYAAELRTADICIRVRFERINGSVDIAATVEPHSPEIAERAMADMMKLMMGGRLSIADNVEISEIAL